MIHRPLYYLRLLRAYFVARRFRARYEHLARDVPFHPGVDVRLDVYSPGSGADHPVLVFVHGGAWSKYHKELFSPVAMRLLPEGIVVVIPDHTLYPDARYERMTREVAAALSWTLEIVGEYGGDPRRVVVAGHSSGAHLAGLAVMDPRFLRAYGHASDEVSGMLGLGGGYDVPAQYAFERAKDSEETPLMRTMVGVMGGKRNFSEASPIRHVDSDLPPVLLIHGDEDRTVPVSQSEDLHAALQEAGARCEMKVYAGCGHADFLFDALLNRRARTVKDIVDFMYDCTER